MNESSLYRGIFQHVLIARSLYAILLLLFSVGSVLAQDDLPNRQLEEVKKNLAEVSTYYAELKAVRHLDESLGVIGQQDDDKDTLPDMITRTRVWGQRPDKMRIETNLPSMDSSFPKVSILAVFDGKYVWIQSRMSQPEKPGDFPLDVPESGITSVISLNLEELTSPDDPFNISPVQLAGTGLAPGRDLLGTIQALIQEFKLEHVESVEHEQTLCEVFEGRILPGTIKTIFKRTWQSPLSQERLDRLKWAIPDRLKILFGKDDGFMREYVYRNDKGARISTVTVEKVVLNVPIDPAMFTYERPEGVVFSDNTAQVKEARNRCEAQWEKAKNPEEEKD